MPTSPQARKSHPPSPAHWQARLAELEVDGKSRRCLTSLQQGVLRAQIAKLYVQRWEIELGFREIKQSMLSSGPVMRSQQPQLILQELWGTLIAYQLLRRWLDQMAQRAKQPANRMAFEASSYAIVNILRFANLFAPANIPKQLEHCNKRTCLCCRQGGKTDHPSPERGQKDSK